MDYDFTNLDEKMTKLSELSDSFFSSMNSDTIDAINALSQTLSDQLTISIEASNTIQNVIGSISTTRPDTHFASDAIALLGKSLSSYNFSISPAIQALTQLTSSLGSLPNLSNAGNTILNTMTESMDTEEIVDYVTIDEKAVQEFKIPDTIAIPIGNKKLKISTDIFINLLITLLFSLLTLACTVSHNNKVLNSQQQYQEQKLKLKQERNQIESDFFDSIDTSTSSQAETIKDLKESLLFLELHLQELNSNSDSNSEPHEYCSETLDNNHE